jgi:hypothetical protein
MSARSVSVTQDDQDAKARLAAAMVMSHFAPSLIAEPSGEAPYGRDHQGNPQTRQAKATEEGKHPLQTGMVGAETAAQGVLANVTIHQNLRGLWGGVGAGFVNPARHHQLYSGGGYGGGGAPIGGGYQHHTLQ